MVKVTTETKLRVVIVDVEDEFNSFVVKEIIADNEDAAEEIYKYQDLRKYRIITV